MTHWLVDRENKSKIDTYDRYMNPFEDYVFRKKDILNPDSYLYGAVLVEVDRVRVGKGVSIRVFKPSYIWEWKPITSKLGGSFAWLNFMINWNSEWDEVAGEVVKDHLRENQHPPLLP